MAVLQAVQKISGAVQSGDATSIFSIPMAVSPSASFLVVGIQDSERLAEKQLFDYRFLSGSSFAIERGTATSKTYKFLAYVASFESGLDVQHRTTLMTASAVGTTRDITLSAAVFLSTSFVLCTHSTQGGGILWKGERFFTADLADTNADDKADVVRITGHGSGSAVNRICCQVITHAAANVQRGQLRFLQTDAEPELTATIATATNAEAIILATRWGSGTTATDVQNAAYQGRFASQTEVAFARGAANAADVHSHSVAFQIVRFFDGTKVQHVPFSLAGAIRSATAAITSVVQANSIVMTQQGMGDGLYCGGKAAASAQQNYGNARATLNLIGHDRVRVERETAGASVVYNLMVITFSLGTAVDIEPLKGDINLIAQTPVAGPVIGTTPAVGRVTITGLSLEQFSEVDLQRGSVTITGQEDIIISLNLDESQTVSPSSGEIQCKGNVITLHTFRRWQPAPVDPDGWQRVA